MVVMLALLDEAATPGVFNEKLSEACNNNGLPVIQYNLGNDTAEDFRKTLCGTQAAQTIRKENPGPSAPSTPSNTTKQYRDLTRSKKSKIQQEIEIINTQSEESTAGARKKIRQTQVPKPKIAPKPTPETAPKPAPRETKQGVGMKKNQQPIEYSGLDYLLNQEKHVTFEISDTPETLRSMQPSPSADDLIKGSKIEILSDTTSEYSESEHQSSLLENAQITEKQTYRRIIIYDNESEKIIFVEDGVPEEVQKHMKEYLESLKRGDVETVREMLLLQWGVELRIL